MNPECQWEYNLSVVREDVNRKQNFLRLEGFRWNQ